MKSIFAFGWWFFPLYHRRPRFWQHDCIDFRAFLWRLSSKENTILRAGQRGERQGGRSVQSELPPLPHVDGFCSDDLDGYRTNFEFTWIFRRVFREPGHSNSNRIAAYKSI